MNFNKVIREVNCFLPWVLCWSKYLGNSRVNKLNEIEYSGFDCGESVLRIIVNYYHALKYVIRLMHDMKYSMHTLMIRVCFIHAFALMLNSN